MTNPLKQLTTILNEDIALLSIMDSKVTSDVKRLEIIKRLKAMRENQLAEIKGGLQHA